LAAAHPAIWGSRNVGSAPSKHSSCVADDWNGEHEPLSFDESLITWLKEAAYQLDGTMRVAGVSDSAVRREVVESFVITLAGSLSDDPHARLGLPAQIAFAAHGRHVAYEGGSCDYRHCATAAVSRFYDR
jgi:hypothetical protein